MRSEDALSPLSEGSSEKGAERKTLIPKNKRLRPVEDGSIGDCVWTQELVDDLVLEQKLAIRQSRRLSYVLKVPYEWAWT